MLILLISTCHLIRAKSTKIGEVEQHCLLFLCSQAMTTAGTASLISSLGLSWSNLFGSIYTMAGDHSPLSARPQPIHRGPEHRE